MAYIEAEYIDLIEATLEGPPKTDEVVADCYIAAEHIDLVKADLR